MGNSTRRKNARRKQPGCTSKLTCKISGKVSGQSARWSNLPEGPLLRMFEVMAGQEDGRSRVRKAQLVCRAWRTSALEVVLGDTATSKPCRPPMQTASDQSKPAATMNTCGAMMVGSNHSKEVSNDGVEVCSKPPQPNKAIASSSGNMVATLQQIDEAEQAGSVEQPAPAVDQHAPAVAKTGRLPKQGLFQQPTRRVTRAVAAAAAAADQAHAQQSHDAAQEPLPAAASISERGQPTQTAEPGEERDVYMAAESSEEVQGGAPTPAQTRQTACQSSHGTDRVALHQHTPDQDVVQQGSGAVGSQAVAGWRSLEARVEGAPSIWSIFKRFSRRPQAEA